MLLMVFVRQVMTRFPGVHVGAAAGLVVATPPSPILVSRDQFIVNAFFREAEGAVQGFS